MVRGASPIPASAQTPPYLHPGLDPAVAERRLAAGRIAEHTAGTPDEHVAAAGPPAYFRTYDQVKGALRSLAERFPTLAKLEDIGDSGEKVAGKSDRDILALRLSNSGAAAGAAKPRTLWIGGVHAREIANPEELVRWATRTLEGYGRDPEATAILDTREIDIVPIVNPDGHAVVEQGYAEKNGSKLWHRKTTSPPNGTDPNRNYDFHWGTVGSSSNPQSEIYRGPSPASEPEVQAVQRFATANKPNLMIDWHSYSRLVLYPWGDTHKPAPDYEGLRGIARKFAGFNHYTPEQGIDLYATSGSSKDWAYGTLGIPAFTVETGDDFHQSDKQYEETWALNAPVMTYAAKIADKPYERAQGPDTVDMLVTPDRRAVTAQISDVYSGGDAVAGAELVTDPNAAPGTGVPLLPVDGRWDSSQERATLDLVAPLTQSEAPKLAYVRARDTKGNWGPLTAQWLTPPPAEEVAIPDTTRETQR